jgi:hypothetical protein
MATSKAGQFQGFLTDPVAAEEHAFRQKRGHPLQRYAGQFVALYRGRVVGYGPDDEGLARRCSSSSETHHSILRMK